MQARLDKIHENCFKSENRKPLQPVDDRRHVSRAKAVINIDHAHIRGAGIHHPQQRGQAFKRSAITDTGGNRNHGSTDEPADYAGQRALHPRAHDDHARLAENFLLRQQAVDAGNPHVVDSFDLIAHEFRGDHGFFGHGDVAGSGGDYRDHPFAIDRFITAQHDGAGDGFGLGTADDSFHGCKLLLGGASSQHVLSMLRQSLKNCRHLRRSLPLSENHFRHAHAQGPGVIDLGKAEVFKGKMAELAHCVVRGDAAGADLREKLADGFGVHERSRWLKSESQAYHPQRCGASTAGGGPALEDSGASLHRAGGGTCPDTSWAAMAQRSWPIPEFSPPDSTLPSTPRSVSAWPRNHRHQSSRSRPESPLPHTPRVSREHKSRGETTAAPALHFQAATRGRPQPVSNSEQHWLGRASLAAQRGRLPPPPTAAPPPEPGGNRALRWGTRLWHALPLFRCTRRSPFRIARSRTEERQDQPCARLPARRSAPSAARGKNQGRRIS